MTKKRLPKRWAKGTKKAGRFMTAAERKKYTTKGSLVKKKNPSKKRISSSCGCGAVPKKSVVRRKKNPVGFDEYYTACKRCLRQKGGSQSQRSKLKAAMRKPGVAAEMCRECDVVGTPNAMDAAKEAMNDIARGKYGSIGRNSSKRCNPTKVHRGRALLAKLKARLRARRSIKTSRGSK